VLIITYMVTSSSSAYGSSSHDNVVDGNYNKKNFITPGKRKNTHDDGMATAATATTTAHPRTTKKPT
jgi:hypothetical protein